MVNKVKKCLGFTLFEILMVLAMISIIASLTVPVFINYQSRQNLELAVAELKGSVYRAQLRARMHGRVMTVHVGTGSSTNNETTISWNPSEPASLIGSGTTVYFGPLGYPQNSASDSGYAGEIVIKICENTEDATLHSRRLKINRIGHVSDSGLIEGCS